MASLPVDALSTFFDRLSGPSRSRDGPLPSHWYPTVLVLGLMMHT